MSADHARRRFLTAAGMSFGLPWLESASADAPPAPQTPESPRTRMVCIGNMLGFYPDAFWPGKDANVGQSRTLKSLARHQSDLTLIQGLDHGIKGGHFSIHAYLSGVKYSDAATMPNGNISVDQAAAEAVVGQTRFNSLTIGSQSGIHGGCQMSWTRSGTRVPPISGPQALFDKLFVDDDAKNRSVAEDRMNLRSSILDAVAGDAKRLSGEVNRRDRDKLDEYFTSIREVENRLSLRRQWLDIPKPEASMDRPKDADMVTDLPLLYELIALALQTNSTRVATLEIGGDFLSQSFGFKKGYHALSHHGQVRESIEALVKMETYQVEQFAKFLDRLKSMSTEGGDLLDDTMVLFGSGMANANSHTNSNLPLVLAGGPFRHTGHLSFDMKSPHRPPMTNLFVSMLQAFGVTTDQFATSSGTLRGLDVQV